MNGLGWRIGRGYVGAGSGCEGIAEGLSAVGGVGKGMYFWGSDGMIVYHVRYQHWQAYTSGSLGSFESDRY